MHAALRIFSFASVLGLSAVSVVSCTNEVEEAEPLCVAGSNVFCRCRGGAPGTKQCIDGNSFGPCESASGSCDEQIGGGGEGGSSKPPGGGPPPPPGELLAPCTTSTECATGHCEMGFCTKGCGDYQECAPPEPAQPGDCVAVPGVVIDGAPGVCVPYCVEQSNCEVYGPNSRCGYTDDSFPTFDVVVCADWDQVSLPPDGYPEGFECDDDALCNLGLLGVERICTPEGCADGCNVDDDCPDLQECSAGTCGNEPTFDPDTCPGRPIGLNLGETKMFSGDTSVLMAPDEVDPVLGCTNEMATEEEVWAVTVNASGNLLVLVEPAPTFDAILFGRRGCTDGSEGAQVLCADDEFEGADEIAEVAVTAGETIHVFVEGYVGSVGSYDITFDLSAP